MIILYPIYQILINIDGYGAEVKSLAAVILRRNISSTASDSQDINNSDNNLNLWKRLSETGREYVKTELLKTL